MSVNLHFFLAFSVRRDMAGRAEGRSPDGFSPASFFSFSLSFSCIPLLSRPGIQALVLLQLHFLLLAGIASFIPIMQASFA